VFIPLILILDIDFRPRTDVVQSAFVKLCNNHTVLDSMPKEGIAPYGLSGKKSWFSRKSNQIANRELDSDLLFFMLRGSHSSLS
jgi:hypothetical protein